MTCPALGVVRLVTNPPERLSGENANLDSILFDPIPRLNRFTFLAPAVLTFLF